MTILYALSWTKTAHDIPRMNVDKQMLFCKCREKVRCKASSVQNMDDANKDRDDNDKDIDIGQH